MSSVFVNQFSPPPLPLKAKWGFLIQVDCGPESLRLVLSPNPQGWDHRHVLFCPVLLTWVLMLAST